MRRWTFATALAASPLFGAVPYMAAAAQPRLAIDVAADATLDSKAIDRYTSRLTGLLLKSGKFDIVDRERVAAAIREQGFSNSAYADPKTAAALGKIVGASRLLHITLSVDVSESRGGFVTTMSASASASFKVVSVETARIVAAGTADGSAQQRMTEGLSASGASLTRQALDNCANDLADQLSQ